MVNEKLAPEKSPTLSVVIPALNEEDGIKDICERVQAVEKALQKSGVAGLELIVVDDGSDDGTADAVLALDGVRLVRHSVNKGYGAAIKTGFKEANGELLAFLDADSTYPPESFPELCRAVLEEGADVVVGSRRSGSSSSMPAMRRLGNLLWSNLLSFLGRRPVVDPASGMRVIRASVLPKLYPLPDGLNFTPVMSARAIHEGIDIKEIPIPYHERSGRSKLSVVKDGTRFLKTIVWTVLEYNPARVLGLLGTFALAISFLIGLGLIVLRFQGVTELGPWGIFAVFNSLVLGVAGISVLSLGITFNYLVTLFHTKAAPQRMLGSLGDSLDRHFGWIGAVLILVGALVGLISFILGLTGWEIARIWLWMLGSAMFTLVGLQTFFSWILMRLLEGLSERDVHVEKEIGSRLIEKLDNNVAGLGDMSPRAGR